MPTLREACTARALLQLNGPDRPGAVPAAARAGVAGARLGAIAAGHRSIILKKPRSGGTPTLPPAPPARVGGRAGPLTRHYVPLELEFRAAGDGIEPPDAICEELYAWAVRALVDTDLGGFAITVHEGPSHFADPEQADYPLVRLRAAFIAELAVDPDAQILFPVGGRADDPQAPFGAMASIAATPAQLIDGLEGTFDESRLTVAAAIVLTGTNTVTWTMEPALHAGAIAAVVHRFRIAALSAEPFSSATIQPAIDGQPRGTAHSLTLDGTPQTFEEAFRVDPATGLPWTRESINAARWGWWAELSTIGPFSQVSGRVMEFHLRVLAG